MQAELLQQEIINRQRLSIAANRLLADVPKQAQAAEERMFMAEYVRGYQLVRFPPFPCFNLNDVLCLDDKDVQSRGALKWRTFCITISHM